MTFLLESRRAILVARKIYSELREARAGTLGGVIASAHPGVTPVTEDFAYNFLQYTCDKFDIDIKVNTFDRAEGGSLDAYILRFDERGRKWAQIGVSQGSHCHERFFTCKELMHIHLATEENMTSSSDDFVQLLEELTSQSNSGQTQGVQTLVDRAAWVGAVELLMPTELLNFYMSDPMEIDDPEVLAEIFRIPKWLMEQAISPGVREFFRYSIETDSPDRGRV